MANNYTPAYKNYLSNSAGYVLPSSVRTYSVFDPSSNSWKRMTNDGMSPIPAQGQTPVADALALARQTQGRDWSTQPAQTPLGGSRVPSNGQQRGGMGVPASPASGVPQKASQGQIPSLGAGGYAEIRREYGDPEADIAFLHEQPVGQPLLRRQAIPVRQESNNPILVRNMSPDYQSRPINRYTATVPPDHQIPQRFVPSDTAEIDVTANMRDNDDDTIYDPNAPSMYNAGTPKQQAEFKRKLGNFLEGAAAVATLGAPAFPFIGARIAASPVGLTVGKGLAKFGKGFKAGADAAWKNYKNTLSLGENVGAKGFSRYTSKNPVLNPTPSAEVQAQRLAEYQNRINPAPFSYGTSQSFPFGF